MHSAGYFHISAGPSLHDIMIPRNPLGDLRRSALGRKCGAIGHGVHVAIAASSGQGDKVRVIIAGISSSSSDIIVDSASSCLTTGGREGVGVGNCNTAKVSDKCSGSVWCCCVVGDGVEKTMFAAGCPLLLQLLGLSLLASLPVLATFQPGLGTPSSTMSKQYDG